MKNNIPTFLNSIFTDPSFFECLGISVYKLPIPITYIKKTPNLTDNSIVYTEEHLHEFAMFKQDYDTIFKLKSSKIPFRFQNTGETYDFSKIQEVTKDTLEVGEKILNNELIILALTRGLDIKTPSEGEIYKTIIKKLLLGLAHNKIDGNIFQNTLPLDCINLRLDEVNKKTIKKIIDTYGKDDACKKITSMALKTIKEHNTSRSKLGGQQLNYYIDNMPEENGLKPEKQKIIKFNGEQNILDSVLDDSYELEEYYKLHLVDNILGYIFKKGHWKIPGENLTDKHIEVLEFGFRKSIYTAFHKFSEDTLHYFGTSLRDYNDIFGTPINITFKQLQIYAKSPIVSSEEIVSDENEITITRNINTTRLILDQLPTFDFQMNIVKQNKIGFKELQELPLKDVNKLPVHYALIKYFTFAQEVLSSNNNTVNLDFNNATIEGEFLDLTVTLKFSKKFTEDKAIKFFNQTIELLSPESLTSPEAMKSVHSYNMIKTLVDIKHDNNRSEEPSFKL